MSTDESEVPLGQRNYASFATRYADMVATKPHNALYERPATLSLLPEKLDGLDILDAGCGPGLYSEILAGRGARVHAIDVTPEMVEIARARLSPFGIEVTCADLAAPLAWLRDGQFDLVLSPLVLDHIRDWHKTLAEFHRVTRPGGSLVISLNHPMSDWKLQDGQGVYYDTELYALDWVSFGDPVPRVTAYRRPLEAALNPLIETGWTIDRILEPQPVPEMQNANPKLYDKLSRAPCFLCIRARRG